MTPFALRSFSPRRNPEAIVGFACAFLLIVLAIHQAGISADSITYTSVARNMQHGSLRGFDGDNLVDFPLGYPVFLGIITFFTHVDPPVFGIWLNGFLFGLLIYISVAMLKDAGWSLAARICCGTCLVLGPPLFVIYGMLWSETLFLLLIGIFIACAASYGLSASNRALWGMIVTAALAGITRYAGLALIGTGGLLLLVGIRANGQPRRKWRALLLYCLTAPDLLLANLLRNHLISGYYTGDRKKDAIAFLEHLHRFGGVLCHWLPGLRNLPGIFTLVGAAFVVLTGLCFAWWTFRKRDPLSLYSVCAAWAFMYSVFILATASITAFQAFEVRLLSPLYMPAFFAFIGLFSRAGWRVAVFVPVLLLVGINATEDWSYVAHPKMDYQDNIRYDMDSVRASPTLGYVNSHPELFKDSTVVYTNSVDLLYFFTGRSLDYLPDLQAPDELEDFRTDDGAYVIWIDECHAYGPKYWTTLTGRYPVSLFRAFPDGAIYIRK